MPVNLEIKARLIHPEKAILTAGKLNCSDETHQHQQDTYFHVKKGRLKLRVISGHESELIYYRRLESEDIRKSDYSVYKFPAEKNPGPILELALGKIVTVKKHRRVFIYKGARIHIDDVEGLGWFIEFEVPVTTDGPGSQQLMDELFGIFKLSKHDIIRVSYMDLLMKGESGRPAGNPSKIKCIKG